MNRFTDSIRKSLKAEDWYGALSTALTLPDVCGRLEDPTLGSKVRYVKWFKKWIQPQYTKEVGANKQEYTFLRGEDCYALRCSYLHEGGGNIEDQKAKIALENFHFIAPPKSGSVHCNKSDNMLQLQVDIFCQQIADAIDTWSESVSEDQDIQSRIKNLLIIHNSDLSVRF